MSMRTYLRQTSVVALLGGTIFLTGCGTTGPLTQEQINALIAQIQTYTAQACAFQPTAASVATVIAALVPQAAPAVGVVNLVGDAICKAPTTKAAVRRGVVQATRIVSTPKGPIAVTGRNL